MKKILHIAVLAVFVLSSMIAAIACGSDAQETTPPPAPEVTPSQPESTPEPEIATSTDPYEILITENGLVPATLTVPVGTKVTWYNIDNRPNARHWMKALDGSFDTRAIPKPSRMSITFNEKGVYEYECIFHEDREDEKGTIIVE